MPSENNMNNTSSRPRSPPGLTKFIYNTAVSTILPDKDQAKATSHTPRSSKVEGHDSSHGDQRPTVSSPHIEERSRNTGQLDTLEQDGNRYMSHHAHTHPPTQVVPSQRDESYRHTMEAGRPCDSASEGPRSIQTSSAPPMSGSIERYAAELARVEKLLAKQDRELGESQDLNRTYEHEFSLARARFEEQQRIIESLTAERDMLAARQLNVNTFDSSLDRVSEGQIKGEVESLNSNITDTIMNLIETLTPLLASKATPYRIEVEPRDSIISLCVQLGRNANEFDLLLEAILHKFVIRRLHKTFFYGFVAAASRTVPFHKEIDMLFSQEVQKTETWKVAQRWRAVTADAIGRMYPPPVWRGDIEKLMNEITEHVAHSLSMDPTHISPMIISHQPAWEKLWFQALALAISVRRDCLSSQMTVIMISSREAYDPDQMALAWDLPAKEGDYVLGTYSVGLLKQDEKGTETILIQPRVFTNGLLRFAKSAQ